MDRVLHWSLNSTGRLVALGLIVVTFPLILAIDLYLTPWRVPTRILYAIPIMVAARVFSARGTIGVTLVAIAFSVLDAWLAGVDLPTEALAILALAAIGLLSLLWADAERRIRALAAERARLHEQELQRAAELEESRARLLEFFSMVTHDLRGPLTAIQGYGQMLPRWDTLSPSLREKMITNVSSSIRQIVRLAADLQDASRVGAGRFEIDREPIDLVALAREIVDQRQPAAPGHRLILEARAERLEGRWDCDRMVQVIGNLVDNAVKYSPDGGEVRVVVERSDDHARVVVSDQGIGIAPEDLPRLFQPYARLRREPGPKGLGLGLYIVRGIVEAHGGTIAVRSEPRKGSTFTVELPLSDVSDESLAAGRPRLSC
ncbi:MAG: HAMP domain-containing histidine kinase [Chloroflexi bacterium]|nr:HAMP domain-containing histidine kinase [Chloroflexota bacterium]